MPKSGRQESTKKVFVRFNAKSKLFNVRRVYTKMVSKFLVSEQKESRMNIGANHFQRSGFVRRDEYSWRNLILHLRSWNKAPIDVLEESKVGKIK